MKYLWRNETEINIFCKTDNSIDSYVFPSGRQAIEFSLKGDDRVDRIAIPEYSSQCVINAVGSYTMPIPVREVLEHNISVKGILAYEQWGWSFEENVIDEITQKFDKVIFDCVDSPNAYTRYKGKKSIIISLSKCLGLKGGALLFKDAILVGANTEIDDHVTLELDNPKYIHIINTHINTKTHIGHLSNVDILSELEKETIIRNKNLKLFANSTLSNNWNNWMFRVIDDNCSAGIIPLFKGQRDEEMKKINTRIRDELGINSEVYNFNWSGHPLDLDYQPCVAFPIHSDIPNIIESIEILEKIIE